MRDDFKEVEVKGVRYQIGRLDAEAGSWILTQILPNMQAGKITDFDKATFGTIQKDVLAVCKRADSKIPVIDPMGRWSDPELKYDLITVMALTVQAVYFNFSDFFGGDGWQEIMKGLPDFNPSSSPA